MSENYGPRVPADSSPERMASESSAHPVGTGVGAAGGAVTGAAIGTAVGGPVGTLVGGAVGAAAGAIAGHGVAKAVNPTEEDAYWRDNYTQRAYVERNRTYDDYRPAYRYGWESRERLGDRPFREVESDLERGWDAAKGESKLDWKHAKDAAGDAWQRIKGH